MAGGIQCARSNRPFVFFKKKKKEVCRFLAERFASLYEVRGGKLAATGLRWSCGSGRPRASLSDFHLFSSVLGHGCRGTNVTLDHLHTHAPHYTKYGWGLACSKMCDSSSYPGISIFLGVCIPSKLK